MQQCAVTFFPAPLLAALDPERAHGLTLAALRSGLVPASRAPDPPSLRSRVFGFDFPNPLGLAAGFDKNAQVPDAMLKLGFGFVETGTVTPRPQAGNPRPRIFRLAEDEAVINRLGFNNRGAAAAKRSLLARGGRAGIVGVNIGANRDSTDPAADYAAGLADFGALARYITVNISSPNTPGLRDLQNRAQLETLARRLRDAHRANGQSVPLLLKIAPDLEREALADIVEIACGHGFDGLIISNTTIARPATLKSRHANETGGLSGCPLFAPSTALLAEAARLVKGRLALVGVGGIASGADAYAKIRAGASLVQLYTALVYQGPGLITRIKRELAALLARDGLQNIADAVGADLR